MAKALLGHLGGPEVMMAAEVRRLRQRVRELEGELSRLQEENAALSTAVDHHDIIRLSVADREPALAGR